MCINYRDIQWANSILKIELFFFGMNAYLKKWHSNESRFRDAKLRKTESQSRDTNLRKIHNSVHLQE